MLKPTIGRIVHYELSEADANLINERYATTKALARQPREIQVGVKLVPLATGVQSYMGNFVASGDLFPLIIVRVWQNNAVNGQVILDGNDSFWACSVGEGDGPGKWHWPALVTVDIDED